MTRDYGSTASSSRLRSGDADALEHLRRAVLGGEHWFRAVLDAIALWTSPDEVYDGVRYRYLIADEAFDWLRLAERLAGEISDFVPAAELERLLFHGIFPIPMDDEEFRRRIGPVKYRAHLNFFYGVVVEEALLLAAEEQLAKEGDCSPLLGGRRRGDDGHHRVYGLSQAELLRQFLAEQGRQPTETLSLDDAHEFTYWLFKYRLKWLDKARVASDTKKGLTTLQRVRSVLPAVQPEPQEEWIGSA